MGVSQVVYDSYRNKTRYGDNHVELFAYDIQLMNLRMLYDDTMASNDTELIAYVENAVWRVDIATKVQAGVSSIALIVVCGLFLLSVWRLWELQVMRRAGGVLAVRAASLRVDRQAPLRAALPPRTMRAERRNHKNTNGLTIVGILALYNLVSLCLGAIQIWLEMFELDYAACQLTWKVSGALYVLSNWLLYWIMLKRANVALNNSMFDQSSWIHTLKKSLVVSMVGAVSYVVVPFFAVHGVYVPDGNCCQFSHPFVASFFVGIDSLFCLCLLALFAFPLFNVIPTSPAHESSQAGSAKVLRVVVMRNVKLSLLAVVSTFVAMVFTASVESISGGLPQLENLDQQYLRQVNTSIIMLDILVNKFVAHSLTSSWKPGWLMKLNRKRKVAAKHEWVVGGAGGDTLTRSLVPAACGAFGVKPNEHVMMAREETLQETI
jgi:hypothetical protein